MVSTQCWLLLRRGRLAAAQELATQWADEVEPRISRATPAELSAWGWLLLAGLRCCDPGQPARRGRRRVALRQLGGGRDGAGVRSARRLLAGVRAGHGGSEADRERHDRRQAGLGAQALEAHPDQWYAAHLQ